MQYILSKEEYDALVNGKLERAKMADKKLQKLCTKICNEMPVKWGWDINNDEPKPWTCKLNPPKDPEYYEEWYCDQCPVVDICPCTEKEFSQ